MDNSWYTRLNLAADNLASLGRDVDCIVPLSLLMDGTLTRPVSKAEAKAAAAAGTNVSLLDAILQGGIAPYGSGGEEN